MGSIAVLLPEIILVTAALGSAVLGFLVGKRTEILWMWALATLVIAMVLTFDMMGLGITRLVGLNLYEVPVSGVPGASGDLADVWKLQVDTFTLFFHIVFMFVALLAVLASRSFIKPEEPHQGEYYCLLFLAVVGMMFTAAATDLFVLYLAFEISSISTFALVAFRKKDKQATEAALKFFIIGSVSSAIILFGISLVYGVAGSSRIASVGHLTDLAVLKGKLSTAVPAMEAPLIVAIVFLLAGFGFKVAVVPFHMWAPDVYQGSPTTISTFLAAGSKKVGIVALFKVFLVGLLAIQVDWIAAIAVLAIVTQTVGNLFAIPQRNIKRMLAYSSIAQVGYILIAIPVGAVAIRGNEPGATGDAARIVAAAGLLGGMYHVLTHAIMKGGSFLVVAATSTAGVGEDIADYKGLGKRMPFVAWSMTIFLFSLAGIPVGGGFVSKFLLFSSAVSAIQFSPWFLALAVSGVLNSALSLYYYARVVWYMLVLEAPQGAAPVKEGRSLTTAIALSLVLTILTFIAAFPFIEFLQGAARTFFGF